MRLSTQDFALLQTSILQLYEHRRLEDFKQVICSIMLSAIPADCFAWNVSALGPEPRMIDYIESDERTPPELREQWGRTLHLHPFSIHYQQTGDFSPLRLSDFASQRDIDTKPLFRESLKPVHCRYQLAAAILDPGANTVSGLNFLRETRDFSERDRTMLDLFRLHAAQARQNAEKVSALLGAGVVKTESDAAARLAQLTPREREVASWLALGKSNPEIAIILNASARTIDKHLEHIFAKLGVENRTSAALFLASKPEASPEI